MVCPGLLANILGYNRQTIGMIRQKKEQLDYRPVNSKYDNKLGVGVSFFQV